MDWKRHPARWLWWMFYTGVSIRDGAPCGVATSADLIHWTKDDANPVLSADPRWYEHHDPDDWHEEARRDPWVFANATTGDFQMFLCARANHGPADGRGVIGHARSDDLRQWTAVAPVNDAGEFGHLEVPQLIGIGPRWYLVFSVADWRTPHRVRTARLPSWARTT